jgi:hypothetical protein
MKSVQGVTHIYRMIYSHQKGDVGEDLINILTGREIKKVTFTIIKGVKTKLKPHYKFRGIEK